MADVEKLIDLFNKSLFIYIPTIHLGTASIRPFGAISSYHKSQMTQICHDHRNLSVIEFFPDSKMIHCLECIDCIIGEQSW